MSYGEAGRMITGIVADEQTESPPPPQKPAEIVSPQADSAGVRGERANHAVIAAELADPETTEPVIEAEVVEPDDRAYDVLMSDYIDAGGTDFTQWAAEALCRSEEEVNSPEQFTPEMIKRLGLRLEQSGI
jgi:hypothetical protein